MTRSGSPLGVALVAQLALSLLLSNGCGEGLPGMIESEEEDGRGTFSNRFEAGSEVEVCGTSSDSGLNLRTRPSTAGQVLDVLAPGSTATVQSSAGSWYRLVTEAGDEGWSYGRYLCANGEGDATGDSSETDGCTGGYRHPAPGYRVTSEFGSCRDGCSRTHLGIDLGTPSGTPVRAADGGTVIFAGWNNGYGYTVVVSHCGTSTRYAHLSQLVARNGDTVRQGEVIARSGNTGNGTGPHLHFEIRLGGAWGTAINPRKYIDF